MAGTLSIGDGSKGSKTTPVWTEAPARDLDRAGKLVAQAEARLAQLEVEALRQQAFEDSKRGQIELVITSALEVLEEDPSPENREALEKALEVAQNARVLPDLRVRVRKALAALQRTDKRSEQGAKELQRLTAQLESLINTGSAENPSLSSPRPSEALQRHKEETLIQQLKRSLEEMRGVNIDQSVLRKTRAILRLAEKRRRQDRRQTDRLQQLLRIDDAKRLGEHLEQERERSEGIMPGAHKVVGEIQDRIAQRARQEQHQLWLDAELEGAANRADANRLRQLLEQARVLDLVVPPDFVAYLHDLESSPSAASSKPQAKNHLAKLQAVAERFEANATTAVEDAEDEPTLEALDDAKRAIVDAKQSKVSAEVYMPLEKRLAEVEMKNSRRLKVEERLLAIYRVAEMRAPLGCEAAELRESNEIDELKELVAEAEKFEADEDLVENCLDLLERSVEAELGRRDAELGMKAALADHTEHRVLQQAVEEGKLFGLSCGHAEKELNRRRNEEVQREAAEAELVEAAKGTGAKGRKRLEAAIHQAKNVGVPANKLQAALSRLNSLTSHEQQCTLAAGNIRRALPLLNKEPWRLQQLMDQVKALQPWTPELERVVKEGQVRLNHSQSVQSQRKEVQQELRRLVKEVKAARSGGECAPMEHAESLAKALDRARKVGDVQEDLLAESEQILKNLRRDYSQRNVAEHRLRLALKRKDLGEIERSVRQVRALGHSGFESSPSPSSGKMDPPHSARLMQTATSVLRALGDADAKKQEAAAKLQARVCGDDFLDAAGKSPKGSKEWLKEAADALHEARQCGVSSTAIDHAKLELQSRRRELRDRGQAYEALQKSLSKKDAPMQEVMHNLHRLQRLEGEMVDRTRTGG